MEFKINLQVCKDWQIYFVASIVGGRMASWHDVASRRVGVCAVGESFLSLGEGGSIRFLVFPSCMASVVRGLAEKTGTRKEEIGTDLRKEEIGSFVGLFTLLSLVRVHNNKCFVFFGGAWCPSSKGKERESDRIRLTG